MENHNPIPHATQARRLYRTPEEMYPLVEQWLESAENQSDFRERHQLSKSVFSYWLKKYRSEQIGELPAGGFVALSVRSGAAQAADLEVAFPNGVVVRVGARTDAAFIRELAGQC